MYIEICLVDCVMLLGVAFLMPNMYYCVALCPVVVSAHIPPELADCTDTMAEVYTPYRCTWRCVLCNRSAHVR